MFLQFLNALMYTWEQVMINVSIEHTYIPQFFLLSLGTIHQQQIAVSRSFKHHSPVQGIRVPNGQFKEILENMRYYPGTLNESSQRIRGTYERKENNCLKELELVDQLIPTPKQMKATSQHFEYNKKSKVYHKYRQMNEKSSKEQYSWAISQYLYTKS